MIIPFKVGGMNLEISKSGYNGCYAHAFSTSKTQMMTESHVTRRVTLFSFKTCANMYESREHMLALTCAHTYARMLWHAPDVSALNYITEMWWVTFQRTLLLELRWFHQSYMRRGMKLDMDQNVGTEHYCQRLIHPALHNVGFFHLLFNN